MDQDHEQEQAQDLDKICDFADHNGHTRVVWHPVEGCGNNLMTLDSDTLRRFDLPANHSGSLSDPTFQHKFPGLASGSWDLHHTHNFVAVGGRDIKAFDMRAQDSVSTHIRDAHHGLIKDVDFNPNKPYHIVTGMIYPNNPNNPDKPCHIVTGV